MNGAEILYRPPIQNVCVKWSLGDSEPGASFGQHLLCGAPNLLITSHPGIKRCARYLRRKVHDRGLSGQDSLRARVRSWASYAGAILDIEALRQYRTRSLWGIGLEICGPSSSVAFTNKRSIRKIWV